MTVYQAGQRIVLVHTDDPYTDLQPGDTGTVRRHDQLQQTVEISWDNGSALAMCLNAGDRIRPITADQPGGTGDQWESTLARLRAAGATAGGGIAADWWAHNALGAHTRGAVRHAARRLLAGIDDGDPAVLNSLPRFDRFGRSAGAPSENELYTAAIADSGAAWAALDGDHRDAAIEAYRDAFDTTALTRVEQLCRLASSPTGRDVSHLHPQHLRIGSTGLFAGDWAWTDGDRIGLGFVGTLIDWNGWAVFSCTREVAEAIVADQQEHRRELRESLQRQGVPEPEVDQRVNAELTDLRFDGDVIIADQRAQYDDPEAIERITPDRDGRYVVMGWNWCWEAVDPYVCDRIVGELPPPDEAQQWVRLPHTSLRVPHDRLSHRPAQDADAQLAGLHRHPDPRR